jgi:hypothetical protein
MTPVRRFRPSDPEWAKAVQQLKRESGKGLFLGGVKLPLALAELGLIDEYEFVVQPGYRAMGRRCSPGYRSIST